MNQPQKYARKIAVGLCLAALVVSTLPVSAAIEEDAEPVVSAGTSNLEGLALLFSETPGAVGASRTSSGTLTCGQSGHCNVMTCDIDCPATQSKSCKCDPTETKCVDKHNGLNPFDNDEHNMYACTCDCLTQSPTPPPPCRVKVGEVCVIEALIGDVKA